MTNFKDPISYHGLNRHSNDARQQSRGHSIIFFDHLLTANQEALDDNELLKLELENDNKLSADRQTLKCTTDNVTKLLEFKSKLMQKMDKFQSLEDMHSKLKNELADLEQQLYPLENKKREEIDGLKQLNDRIAAADEQEFAKKINELEEKFSDESDYLRERISQRKEQLTVTQAKAEFQHYQRKEDLRKKHANEMKAINVHIECRSAELDLKKEIHRLEQSKVQPTTKNLVPCAATSKSTTKTNVKSNHKSTDKINDRSTPKTAGGNNRKRKLFSVNSNFLDF